MSGHSHWAGIKHKKGLNDAKRGAVFTKHGKLITIAARDGGGNPDMNFQLRLAIDRARAENMPKENIERAIKRGTGELKGEELVEIIYEAMGPGNIMMVIKTATGNRNRTVNEIKIILTKFGGKLGEMGSAMWNFDQVGFIDVDIAGKDKDEMEMLAIDAGAKDTRIEDAVLTVFTNPQDLQKIQKELQAKGLAIKDFGLSYEAKTKTDADENAKATYEKLLEALDEQDDVQDIYDNL
jgi:YebC/PmpR family DNA-binding regulatory protein